MPKASATPGLQWRDREGGRKPYWVALPRFIKLGYRPKSVPLIYEPHNPMANAALVSQCTRLQQEMIAWAEGHGAKETETIFDGKLATLFRIYETDPRSTYRATEPETQINYSAIMRLILGRISGDTYVDQLTGYDIKGIYNDMIAEGKSVSYAAATVAVLKSAVSYGASRNWPGLLAFRGQLSATKFGTGKRRMQELTYPQLRALCAEAHRMGRPSAALWLTLQYELAFRRRDVIGKWVFDEKGTDGIRSGRRVWRDGLTWADIGGDGVLRRLVSKTAKTSAYRAEHTIGKYADLIVELGRIPPEKRVGPIVINEDTGLPYTPQQCMRLFRILREAAGLPKDIQNRDARAGAITEALEGGATIKEAGAMATQTRAATTIRYEKRTLHQSNRAADARLKNRENINQNAG